MENKAYQICMDDAIAAEAAAISNLYMDQGGRRSPKVPKVLYDHVHNIMISETFDELEIWVDFAAGEIDWLYAQGKISTKRMKLLYAFVRDATLSSRQSLKEYFQSAMRHYPYL